MLHALELEILSGKVSLKLQRPETVHTRIKTLDQKN